MKRKVEWQEITFAVNPGPSTTTLKVVKTERVARQASKSTIGKRVLRHVFGKPSSNDEHNELGRKR